jgi:uncharacterized protein with HEPN domain
MKDNRLYIIHMQERIEMILMFTRDGYEVFSQSTMAQEAVLRCFEVLGEAARKLSDDFRNQYPALPWSKVIAFRNVLIHNYEVVDIATVWKIIMDDLPFLKEQLDLILSDRT